MIFTCVSCNSDLKTITQTIRPLCNFCLELLVPASDDFLKLTHPGVDVRSLFLNSLHASYLATGPTHRTLKAWKKSPSLEIESLLLNPYKECFQSLAKDFAINAVTCIPQGFERSWELKGGSSYRLAHWISQKTKIPFVHGLNLKHKIQPQSQLNRIERKQNPIDFEATREIKNTPSVLMVDDWMTTGKTLQSSAFALRMSGVCQVHAWVLGVRPRTQLKCYRWTKPISQKNQLITQ